MGPGASDGGARSAARGDPLALLLDDRGVVVLDGGLATQLEAQGNSLADPLWSARMLLEDPSEIVRAHLAFYRAGAAVATTVSYQATFEGFASRGIDHAGRGAVMPAGSNVAPRTLKLITCSGRRTNTGEPVLRV